MLDPKFTVMLLLREGDAGRITWQHGSVRCLVAPALFSQQIGKKKAYINYVIFGMLQREPLSIITKHFPTVDSFKWFVLGDWGGWPAPHYSSPIQKSVADSMGRTSRIHRPEYIVGLGDNFYYHGVENENDPMFEKTFENIYIGPRAY